MQYATVDPRVLCPAQFKKPPDHAEHPIPPYTISPFNLGYS